MSHLVLELPESLDQQIKDRGLSQQQLGKVMTYLLELYLNIDQANDLIQITSQDKPQKVTRKAGSAKNMGIIIADDFDEPLEDFAEYMY